jgi:transcriptional regulator with XRE-family HTH domain
MNDDLSARFLRLLWLEQQRAGLSSAQLARLIGCKRSYVSRVQHSTRAHLSFEFVARAARCFPTLALFVSSVVLADIETFRTITDASEEGAA